MKILLFIILCFGVLTFGNDIKSNAFLVDKSLYKTYDFKKGKILKKKGDYVLGSMFADKEEMNWTGKFKIAELGGIDDIHINYDLLKKSGALDIKYRLGYDWMPAFYYYTSGKNRKFVKWLYNKRDLATLNPKGPFLHCKKNGYDWCQDYYYNYGDKEILEKRAKDLSSNMKTKGFNGLFFDWASGGFINSKEYIGLKRRFYKLNPDKNYFKMIAKFYRELKKRKIFFVTNQAFRQEKYLLKYITYDMTESYITTDTKIKKRVQIAGKGWVDSIKVTNYYPIYKNSKNLKDSLHFIDLLTKYKKSYKKYGFKNFIYLNYIAPRYEKIYESMPLYAEKKPKNAIYFSYAMAKLTDNLVYAELSSNRKLERSDIYFYDLGEVLGKKYEKIDSIGGYIRFYKNGFVVVSSAQKSTIYLKIKSKYIPNNSYVFNPFENIWLKSGDENLVVKIDYLKDAFTKKTLPAGRVFLYNQN